MEEESPRACVKGEVWGCRINVCLLFLCFWELSVWYALVVGEVGFRGSGEVPVRYLQEVDPWSWDALMLGVGKLVSCAREWMGISFWAYSRVGELWVGLGVEIDGGVFLVVALSQYS